MLWALVCNTVPAGESLSSVNRIHGVEALRGLRQQERNGCGIYCSQVLPGLKGHVLVTLKCWYKSFMCRFMEPRASISVGNTRGRGGCQERLKCEPVAFLRSSLSFFFYKLLELGFFGQASWFLENLYQLTSQLYTRVSWLQHLSQHWVLAHEREHVLTCWLKNCRPISNN